MKAKPVNYKDTRVAPNSALYAALEEARTAKKKPERRAAETRAKAIYDECEKEYRKWTD